jgi:anti-sigma regulatory factor (Ser/Thr protein kinase)
MLPRNEALGAGPFLIEGFSVNEHTLSSSTEKDTALTAVLDLASALDLSDEKKRRIEVASEELLLNAIYDAPRSPDGKALHAGLDRRTPVTLDASQQVRLQYGCDGRNFVVSIADRFGALERTQVVKSLMKLLEPQGPRPISGAGGAGLGLMLTYGAANQLVVQSVAGKFTEVTAVMHVSGSNRTALARGSALHLYLDGRS